MVIFQGSADGIWEIGVWVSTIIMAVVIWYFVIVGRDRPPKKQRRGQDTVEKFGDIEENRAPIPKFLIYTFVGAFLWGLGYLFWTGINGVMGYR
jgi:membrane protein DedA with SNARE-associated domain